MKDEKRSPKKIDLSDITLPESSADKILARLKQGRNPHSSAEFLLVDKKDSNKARKLENLRNSNHNHLDILS